MSLSQDVFSEQTIAAIATPAGRGAIAVLRLSGSDVVGIGRRLFPSLPEEQPFEPRQARLLAVRDPVTTKVLDHALVTFFPGPNSFTGEDSLEISTHGGSLTPKLVLAAALAAGAREALPGEFTRRALLNGKMDLLQAEAILDLVNGTSAALHRAAIHQLERGLSSRITELRRGLIHADALLSYGIDFPDEDEPPVPPETIVRAVDGVLQQLDLMLSSAPQAELLREGALVVLAGRPNAGKSSLFNALLGFERSIVTEIPGTTRDAVEATVSIRGYPFRLVDTAGLRDTTDVIEGIGVEVATRYLRGADLVLYCADGSEPLSEEDLRFLAGESAERLILVRTKADLTGDRGRDDVVGSEYRQVRVGAPAGIGLDVLAGEVLDLAFGRLTAMDADEPLLTRPRHVQAMRAARSALGLFLEEFQGEVPPEFAATHLSDAVRELEEIIGVVSTDDVLGAIFSEFCVGK